MSSFKRTKLILLAGLILSGCGFRPLYAPPQEDQSGKSVYAFDLLKQIAIDNIPDREGQYLRNQLIQLMQPSGRGAETKYVLKVILRETKRDLAVKRSAIATRANLQIAGEFLLSPVDSAGTIESGTVFTSSGYNINQSEFQTLMAEKGARERALDDLAQQMRIRLAAVLTSSEAKTAKP